MSCPAPVAWSSIQFELRFAVWAMPQSLNKSLCGRAPEGTLLPLAAARWAAGISDHKQNLIRTSQYQSCQIIWIILQGFSFTSISCVSFPYIIIYIYLLKRHPHVPRCATWTMLLCSMTVLLDGSPSRLLGYSSGRSRRTKVSQTHQTSFNATNSKCKRHHQLGS